MKKLAKPSTLPPSLIPNPNPNPNPNQLALNLAHPSTTYKNNEQKKKKTPNSHKAMQAHPDQKTKQEKAELGCRKKTMHWNSDPTK